MTDLEMARVDGLELIARVRRDPTLRQLPVVVVTSRATRATRDAALAAGADAVVVKGPKHRPVVDASVQAIRTRAR